MSYEATTGAANEAAMMELLAPCSQSRSIGEEVPVNKVARTFGQNGEDGIALFRSPFGSFRFVFIEDGQALGALQVMQSKPGHEVAANIFVLPEVRRRGIAKNLLQAARKKFKTIQYGPDLTEEGALLLNAIQYSNTNSRRFR